MGEPPRGAKSVIAAVSVMLIAAAAGQGSRAQVILPSAYDEMTPPEVGETYIDPAFGTRIKRLTDASKFLYDGLKPEYAQHSVFNADDTYLVLLAEPNGMWELFDGDGNHIRTLNEVRGGRANPRWSRLHANHLYFHVGNQILRLDVANGDVERWAEFSRYQDIHFGGGQGDISDNERVVVTADERYVFAYDLATRTQFGVLDTHEPPIDGLAMDAAGISPDGDVIFVSFDRNGTARGYGMEQYDLDGKFVAKLLNATMHHSTGRDVDGTQVLFSTNSATMPEQPLGCHNAIVKISLDGQATRTCLLQLDWSNQKHISATSNDGWVYISTYQVAARPVTGAAADQAVWHAYTNEILRMRADGSRIERFAHHRSLVNVYTREPHASISLSGKKLIYGSDFMQRGMPRHYVDSYMIDLENR